jgi:hypothetical protein
VASKAAVEITRVGPVAAPLGTQPPRRGSRCFIQTLGQVAHEHFDFKREKGKRSIRQDEQIIRRLKRGLLADTPITEITGPLRQNPPDRDASREQRCRQESGWSSDQLVARDDAAVDAASGARECLPRPWEGVPTFDARQKRQGCARQK